ncbi:kinase-like protein, partial [Thozetella sp. PMI_491]
ENYESKWYIPATELEKALSAENVKDAVVESKIQPYKQDEVVQAILHGGKKIFAVLLLIDEAKCFVNFLGHDHLQNTPLDAKLPYTQPELDTILGEAAGVLFHRTQWQVLAPVFRGDLSHRVFDKATILPFIHNVKIGNGAFGTVYEVVLDARHQVQTEAELDLPSAVENPDVSDLPEREGHILSFLRLVSHPSIVRLIATYTYRNTYNLIFERAESSLETLLSSEQRPKALQSDWLFYQAMQGLCSAVKCFHNLTHPEFRFELRGFHHDLKPENILVNGSRFLLSDFGLSNLKDKCASSKSLSRDIMGYYISPESESIEDGLARKLVGQPSDIWALGCILAVLLTFMRRGPSGVLKFEQMRMQRQHNWTSYTFHSFGAENPGVRGWLSELAQGASEEDHGLLSLIQDVLQINPSDRPDAAVLSSRMDFLALKANYECMMQTFNSVAKAFEDPLITIENKRAVWFGEAANFHHRSRQWNTIQEPSTTFVDFSTFQNCISNLRGHLELMPSSTDKRTALHSFVLKEIRGTLDQLWNTLTPIAREKFENMLEADFVNTSDLDILSAVHTSFKGDKNYKSIGVAAAIRSMIILTGGQSVEASNLQIKSGLNLTGPEVGPFSTMATMTVGGGDSDKTVLVDWLEYDENWRSSTGKELFSRVESIARILRDEENATQFHSLRCLGYYHSTSHHSFGLVFDPNLLDNELQPSQPLSLTKLIEQCRKLRMRPDLGAKFRLAKALATVVMDWHKVGWVHRRISAFSIIFLGADLDSVLESINKPFFLGFQYSRHNVPDAFTTGPPDQPELQDYCHPAYLENPARHQAEYDYYSLGLVLLEIAYWKRLKDIVSNFIDENQSPENLRNWLIQSPVAEVHTVMGRVYENAIRTCL